jgi:hypothetical protein
MFSIYSARSGVSGVARCCGSAAHDFTIGIKKKETCSASMHSALWVGLINYLSERTLALIKSDSRMAWRARIVF